MNDVVDYTRYGAVGVITVNNPPVNVLSIGVLQGIMDYLARGLVDDTVKIFVLIGAGRTFIAGADIREFGKSRPPGAPDLRDLIAAIESSTKPVVAAIHGNALGGGLEVALGCHYRCAEASARLGLPEVKLGLLPGAGGTQRLPRLIGVERALDMIVGGEPIDAEQAQAAGLCDRIIAGDLLTGAVAFAEELAAEKKPLRKIREMTARLQADRGAEFFAEFRKELEKKARGYLAPFLCVDCVEAAMTLPFAEGAAKERELFDRCLESPQSKALRYLFFAERQAAKVPDVPADTKVWPIERATVIGAGTMGGGIAMAFANAGISVKVLEMSREALDKGLSVVRKNYAGSVQKGRLTQPQMDRRLALITGTLSYQDLGDADVVVEAVFEDMDVKKKVFQTLDEVCRPRTILASNTSSLDIDQIAAATARPQDVIGLHFFSPAHVMRLLEIVRGARTSKETLASAIKLAKTLNKVGVTVGVCDGFVGNRMLAPYRREATFLLEEGALPQQVDRVLQDFGMAMGPFAVGDLAGLDIGWAIRKRQAAARPKSERYCAIPDRVCELGRFGQKTGAGWYRYEPGSRRPVRDPVIEELIVNYSKERGIERRAIGDKEILQRCLYALINEGAKILDEGIAQRASDIDLVYVHGYGFPRYRGGPMFYADTIGIRNVYDAVCGFRDAHGDAWKPASLWQRLIEEGKGFTQPL